MDVQIKRASKGDAHKIAVILQESMEEWLLPLTIYGSEGIAIYIKHTISFDDLSNTQYLVARQEKQSVAAAEFRIYPEMVFLSYIAVHPDARGMKLGARLLQESLRLWGKERNCFGLDVFEYNKYAYDWYTRLGLLEESRVDWLAYDLPTSDLDMPFSCSNLPLAALAQERFGFSLFQVLTTQGRYDVGRLGKSWFRLLTDTWRTDPALPAILGKLDAKRRLLEIVPEGTGAATHLSTEKLATSIRMTCESHVVSSQLEKRLSSTSNS